MKSSTAYPWCLRGVRSTSNERTRSVGIVGDGWFGDAAVDSDEERPMWGGSGWWSEGEQQPALTAEEPDLRLTLPSPVICRGFRQSLSQT